MSSIMAFGLEALEHHLRSRADTDLSDLQVISVGYISKSREFNDLISILSQDSYFKLYAFNEFRLVYLSFSRSSVTKILLSGYPVQYLEGISAIDFLLENIDEVSVYSVEEILGWLSSNISSGYGK